MAKIFMVLHRRTQQAPNCTISQREAWTRKRYADIPVDQFDFVSKGLYEIMPSGNLKKIAFEKYGP